MAHFLTSKEVQLIQGLLDEARGRRLNTPSRYDEEGEDWLPPEVYVAWPQSELGIPALEFVGTAGPGGNDVAGHGLCDIYQIVLTEGDYELQPVEGFSHRVCNVSTVVIPQEWILVVRTKYGKWIAVAPREGLNVFELEEDWVPPVSPYDNRYAIKATRLAAVPGEEETIYFVPPEFFGVGRHGKEGIAGTFVTCRRQDWYMDLATGNPAYCSPFWAVTGGQLQRVMLAKVLQGHALVRPEKFEIEPDVFDEWHYYWPVNGDQKVKLFVKRYDDVETNDVVAGDHAKAEPSPAGGPVGLGSWEIIPWAWINAAAITELLLCWVSYNCQENRWYAFKSG